MRSRRIISEPRELIRRGRSWWERPLLLRTFLRTAQLRLFAGAICFRAKNLVHRSRGPSAAQVVGHGVGDHTAEARPGCLYHSGALFPELFNWRSGCTFAVGPIVRDDVIGEFTLSPARTLSIMHSLLPPNCNGILDKRTKQKSPRRILRGLFALSNSN